MRVATRLRIISVCATATLVLLLPVLVWSFAEFKDAKTDQTLANEILVNYFERASIRDQYFLYREVRLRAMWYQKKNIADVMLHKADVLVHTEEDRGNLERLRKYIGEAGVIFDRIVANAAALNAADGNRNIYEELDRRLTSQLLLRAAGVQDAATALRDSSARRLERTYQRLILIIGLFVITLALGATLTSMHIGRLMRKRLAPLHAGTRIIAGGNLDYRLTSEGSDEFAELAVSINVMTDKLQSFTRTLESEIEERKHAESGLRTLSRAVEQSPASILITDPAGTIEYVNPRFEQVSGYTKAEVLGQNPRILKFGSALAATYEDLWRSIARGGEWRGEICNRRKNGEPYWELVAISGVRGESGEVEHYIAVEEDITERKRAAEALRESEKSLREAQEVGQVGSYVLDIPGDVWRSSPVMDAIFGIGEDYPRTLASWTQLLHPGEREPINAYFREIIAEHRRFEREYRIVRVNDGRERWVSGQGQIEYGADGQALRMTGVIQDITGRKHAESELRRVNAELEQRVEQRTHELLAANSELESFSYSVSHDLRAPLRAIEGFSSLLEKEYAAQLDERGRDYFKRVRGGATRMARLIDDLLNLSRISRQEMNKGPVNLSALARDAAEELRAAEPERRVEWIIAPHIWAEGDPGLVRIVLQNLIGNAWKYSSKRDIGRIEFGASQWSGRPAFFVRDNGEGFDMAFANKLFVPFQRLHSAEEFPGTGIGLATVARIIRRHGGSVGTEGKVHEGATFYFTL